MSHIELFFNFRYYEQDGDVAGDTELQSFANEVSADGTGTDGGKGKVSLSFSTHIT